jgi:hypothetical protein
VLAVNVLHRFTLVFADGGPPDLPGFGATAVVRYDNLMVICSVNASGFTTAVQLSRHPFNR